MVMDEPSPQSVGREFVRQYYTLLNQAPLHLHRFYSQESSFVHGGFDNEKDCQPVRGQQEIHQRIMQLNFRDCKAKIRHVDAHASAGNAVVVQVSGELSNNGQPMRRFMQTFVLGSASAKKYYVHNDIFRYQDEVFSDDDIEEETDELTAENEKNLMAVSPDSTSGSIPPPQHLQHPQQQMLKPIPGTGVGSDGITTVSINASVAAPVMTGVAQQAHLEVKKDVPHLNGGQGHAVAPVIDGPPHMMRVVTAVVAPDITASSVPAPTGAPGMAPPMGIRPPPDVTTSVGGPQHHYQPQLVQPMPQRGAVQPQVSAPQPVVPQAANPTTNHVVAPEPEPESGEDASGSQVDEKEDDFEEPQDKQPEKPPQQPQQQAEPVPVEPRNQGPPTYANLVKSGHTLIPNQGSLPSAGFGKVQSTPAASVGGNGGPGSVSGSSGVPVGNGGQENKDAQGFAGQQQGTGKFRGSRPSLGGGSSGRGGSVGAAPSGGSGRDRERYSFQKDGGEGQNQDGQERRRTIGGGSGGGAGSAQYPDSHQLFVGNLPHNCTENHLEELFGKFGKVVEVRISSKGVAQSKTTASGQRVPNFGFVVFEEDRSVAECLKNKPIHLDGGHRLNVETKKNKPPTRSDGQAMGSLSAPGGSNQNRGSQEHLGNAVRGSDRPRGGGPRGGQRGGGRSEGGGRGGGYAGGSGGGGPRGGMQGGSESRGGPQGQGSSSRGGGSSYSRRS